MAEDMIERAAQAIKDIQGPPFGTPEWLAKHGEKVLARQQRAAEQFARAALLAALDPEDEALVERVAHEYADPFSGYADPSLAKRIIATLRTLAQGETR